MGEGEGSRQENVIVAAAHQDILPVFASRAMTITGGPGGREP
jgi:hypothetical protein